MFFQQEVISYLVRRLGREVHADVLARLEPVAGEAEIRALGGELEAEHLLVEVSRLLEVLRDQEVVVQFGDGHRKPPKLGQAPCFSLRILQSPQGGSAMRDIHGLPLTTAVAAAAEAFNAGLRGYLGYQADASDRLKAALQADPQFALAHCAMGYFMMLAYSRAYVGVAAQAHRAAAELAPRATAREQAHVRALGSWIGGDVDGALRAWETILSEHPTDVLALRLGHLNNFWLGRAADMRGSLARVARS